MPFTSDEIARDWLAGAEVAMPLENLVEGFDTAEAVLGRDWVEVHATVGNFRLTGSIPTLTVASAGWRLASLNGATAAVNALIEKLRRGDDAAWGELDSIYVLRSAVPGDLEIEPAIVTDRGANRLSDFRFRPADGAWIYAETTTPTHSLPAQAIERKSDAIAALLQSITGSYALEAFLNREPTDDEVSDIGREMRSLALSDGPAEVVLPGGLGRLFVGHSPPLALVLDDHGEEHRPRMARARGRRSPDGDASILVRVAFTDDRAEPMLKREANQLPKGEPNLLFIGVGAATAAWTGWQEPIRRLLRPGQFTRISGVVLVQGGLSPTENGETWAIDARLVVNPHAVRPLPEWVLDRFPEPAQSVM